MSESEKPEINPQTRTTLNMAIEAIKNRASTYGQAVAIFAIERTSEGRLLVCCGLITFLRKGADVVEDLHYEYEHLTLVRSLMNIDAAVALLERMYEKHVLEMAGLQPVPFRGTLHRYEFLESRFGYGHSVNDWPSIYVSGSIEQTHSGRLTQSPLVSLNHPLYPNGVEALRALGLRFLEDAYDVSNQIEVVVPDYRARITGLVMEGPKATIEVHLGVAKVIDLVAKFYSRTRHDFRVSGNQTLSDGRAVFDMGEAPLVVEAHILSANDGSTIDKIGYSYLHPFTKAGVVMKDEEVRLLDIISRGENETVEFKRWLEKDNSHHELIETVVAFANTRGGMVILGVTDRGEVEGVLGHVDSGKIHGWVGEFCDPPISVEYRTVILQEKTVVVLDVPEGSNQPYVLKDRGPYVRRGATDRAAKRVEIDEFYRQKRSVF